MGCNPSVAVVIRQVANMVKIAHLVGCDDVVLMAVIRQVTNVVRMRMAYQLSKVEFWSKVIKFLRYLEKKMGCWVDETTSNGSVIPSRIEYRWKYVGN